MRKEVKLLMYNVIAKLVAKCGSESRAVMKEIQRTENISNEVTAATVT
jgi:hypothetical protein